MSLYTLPGGDFSWHLDDEGLQNKTDFHSTCLHPPDLA